MSPSVSRRRRSGRPRRPSRRRDRRPQRLAISAVIMSAISTRRPAIRFALVVTVAWLIATGTYFAFRDDVLTLPTTEMQITYEDHIADLRAQVDRIISRQFLDQEAVEQQLNGLRAAAGDIGTTRIGAHRRSISHQTDDPHTDRATSGSRKDAAIAHQ